MSAWSTVAANEFIRIAYKDDRYLTHMHLQKLVYISHGWTLETLNKGLTLDHPEAWRFGPVYRLLWEQLKHAGAYPITTPIDQVRLSPYGRSEKRGLALQDDESRVLGEVYRIYGHLAPFQLSALTHTKETPWSQVYKGGEGENQIIPDTMIKKHFHEVASAP